MNKKRVLKQKVCKYCGKTFSTVTNKNYCSRGCSNAWRRYFASKDVANTNGKDTLCWECKNATGGGDCPWVNDFTPVEGWTATPTKIKTYYGYDNSFNVRKCPLFIEG